MRIIEMQAPEVWEQKPGFIGVCEHIARCAAICYDSVPKEGGAAVDFVKSLDKRGHGRPLEFGNMWIVDSAFDTAYWNRPDHETGQILTNLRELREQCYSWDFIEREMENPSDEEMPITIHYPALSRAIADELRTHVTLSSLMRSTRYVDEAKEGGIDFIKPYWYKGESLDPFSYACICAENQYKLLLMEGKRQDAREVLPLCVKTELVQCGFPKAWKNLIRQRDSEAAHPDARWLAQRIRELISHRL